MARQHETVVVIGVLADQVDSSSPHDKRGGLPKAFRKIGDNVWFGQRHSSGSFFSRNRKQRTGTRNNLLSCSVLGRSQEAVGLEVQLWYRAMYGCRGFSNVCKIVAAGRR